MKAQSAIELMILVGTVMIIFISFLFIFQSNLSQKTIENKNKEAFELVTTIKNEIDIAASTTDGYSRTFRIPEKIFGQDYNISVQEKIIYFQTSDKKIALSLPTQNVTGLLQKGNNLIRKVNGEILLNQ